MQTATHGVYSPERQEATPPDKSDDATTCIFCSSVANGYDALTNAPSCTRCARIIADGRLTPVESGSYDVGEYTQIRDRMLGTIVNLLWQARAKLGVSW